MNIFECWNGYKFSKFNADCHKWAIAFWGGKPPTQCSCNRKLDCTVSCSELIWENVTQYLECREKHSACKYIQAHPIRHQANVQRHACTPDINWLTKSTPENNTRQQKEDTFTKVEVKHEKQTHADFQ